MASPLDGFQFKQFSIEHAGCAMKVGTDSILLGSWVEVNQATQILDIGTGSGLLAIMMAQKSAENTSVLGIDIDQGAVAQASKNMANSPWHEQLDCQHISVTNMSNNVAYDLIVSNPPYFTFQTPSTGKRKANIEDIARRSARQQKDLDLASLFASASRLLSADGQFYCILPFHQHDAVAAAQRYGLYCHHLIKVHSVATKPAIRQLLCFSLSPGVCHESVITIHQASGQYSEQYKHVCRDFYLKF